MTDAIMGLLTVADASHPPPSTDEKSFGEYLNARLPLAIEWDERLLPPDDVLVNNFLIKEVAAEIRDRLDTRYGVLVPGIRFRSIPEAPRNGLYRIFDHDVVVEEGTEVVEAGTQWQVPLRRTMQRLELHLERHLAQWVRVQEVQNLLEKHCSDLYSKDIPGFETYSHIGPLTNVVRSLVAERVSIRSFSKIYDVYRAMWKTGAHVQSITREIRMLPAIKPILWGNDPSYRRFVLLKGDEDELWRASQQIDGFTTLVLEREQRNAFVSSLESAMSGEAPSSITVRRSELRPLLRRLIEHQLPDCPVLADCELECRVRAVDAVEIGLRKVQLPTEVVA